MTRRGFSLVEMLLVITIIGLVGMIAIPRMRDSVERTNVRAAQVALANSIARTRATAVARGCPATFNITTGTAGKMWITACQTTNVGAGGATETVGNVDSLAARYKVSIASNVASFVFDRRGLRTDYNLSTIRVQSNNSTRLDSIQVNQVGRVIVR
jgi:prepilin-type N-terminal cleavage/methylation domain-containing protein